MLASAMAVISPVYDSAIVQNERIGGNFVYSTIEGTAVKAVAPVVSSYVQPATIVEPKVIAQPYPQFYYAPSYYGGFGYYTAY